MADVAKKSGFSINTVSRALNNKPDIREETKARILQIAQEIGFVKNRSASLLRSVETRIIGVIMADSSNPFYSEVLKGIEWASRKFDYQIILVNTERATKNEIRAVSLLMERRVDGLLIGPVQESRKHIEDLIHRNYPTVIVGRHFDQMEIDEIYSDEINGGKLATQHLIDQGCRKILLLNGYSYKSPSHMRQEGYRQALEAAGIPYDPSYVHISDILPEDGYRAILHTVCKGMPVDGIFCYNDIVAFGAMQALKDNHYRIPEDIAIVGYDDIQYSGWVYPPLTTVSIQKHRMGFEAFRMLLNRLQGKRKKTQRKILPVELIVRKSSLHLQKEGQRV
ncbi:MAG: HTH-type transcriptional repressor CytR [Thermotogae bacterium ADurb.Bin062]|nr:MAG: HTH-type transcriptional repressor CytR [Thermotogota bacterium ADurb.Bin062]